MAITNSSNQLIYAQSKKDTPFRYKSLFLQLVKREVVNRYKGSYLGVLWSFIVPIFMLLIYTFVFSVIFKAKWDIQTTNKSEFALVLFCGLITFNVFAEVISSSPQLILSNVNYVKKVIFPLWILPVVALGSAVVNMLIGLLILQIGLILVIGVFNWTVLLVPVVMVPLILLVLGLGWFLSALGVYLRDIGQVISIVVQALMFLSPIFYPVTSIPSQLRFIFYWNPLSYAVDNMRQVVIWGRYPNWQYLIYGTLIGAIVAILGALWFRKVRGGFSDVI